MDYSNKKNTHKLADMKLKEKVAISSRSHSTTQLLKEFQRKLDELNEERRSSLKQRSNAMLAKEEVFNKYDAVAKHHYITTYF